MNYNSQRRQGKPVLSMIQRMMSFSAFMYSSQFTAKQFKNFFPQGCRFICRHFKPHCAILETMTSHVSFHSRRKLLALSGLCLTLIKRLLGFGLRNVLKHSLSILSQRHKLDPLKHIECLTKPNHPRLPDTVWCVAFDKTGRFIATGNGDHTINVWDLHSDQGNPSRLQTLNGHTEAVRCLMFDPTKFMLVSGGGDKTIIVWKYAKDGKGIVSFKTLLGHCTCITAIQFFKNGKYLLSASLEGILRMWDLSSIDYENPRCIMNVQAHSSAIKSILPNPKISDCIITVGEDRFVKVIKIKNIMSDGSDSSIECLSSDQRHPHRITSAAIEPNTGTIISYSSDHIMIMRDISRYGEITRCEMNHLGDNKMVVCATFLHSGGFLITGCEDFHTRIYKLGCDGKSFHLVASMRFSSSIISVAVDPNGRCIAFGLNDGSTILYS